MVIVDTSIWLQFLKAVDPSVRIEMDLLRAKNDIAMVGIVLAEILQGSRSQQELEQLTDWLKALPYLDETQETWTKVGSLSFQLRRHGVTVPMADLLIAALAIEQDCQVYTLDEHFQRVPGLSLYEAGAA